MARKKSTSPEAPEVAASAAVAEPSATSSPVRGEPDVALTPGEPQEGATERSGYVVLARKYRPATFDDLIGQDAMVTTLRNAFAADRIAQGFMLTGVRGVGKTTTARILARALNYVADGVPDGPTIDMPGVGRHCREIMESRHPDVIEMDAASNTGVDNVREIIESARYRPLAARYKVFIIDEVHMLSKGAFNALLKTLEEPPAHVKFIFATTEIRRVPVTVLSRCQRFDLRRVDVPLLVRHFRRIAAAEQAQADDDALALIARAAEGSVRDGLSLLDQAIATAAGAEGGAVTASLVRNMLGLADRSRLFDLVDLVLSGAPGKAVAALAALHDDGADPLEVLAELAEVVHLATRVKVAGAEAAGEAISAEERRRAVAIAGSYSVPLLSRAWSMLLKGLDEGGRAPNTLAAAEMVLIRIAHAADLPPPEEIIRTLGGGSVAARRPVETPRAAQGDTTSTLRVPAPLAAELEPFDDAAEKPSVNMDPPPPGSADDYGADDGGDSLPIDPDAVEDDEDSDGVTPVAPMLADPRSFADVVALAGLRRDIKLKVHLEEHVSLVKFDPAGQIEIHLLAGAPPETGNDLRERLNRWTNRKWIVALSPRPGEPTIASVRREREAAELQALSRHPAILGILEHFPDAQIDSVKPILSSQDDDQEATG